MRTTRCLVLIWICFAVRLAFYSTALPLWEGYDEWAHFSVIRIMSDRGEILVSRNAPIPRDVEASLQLAPVPYEMRYLAAPSLTHDDFWKLPKQARAQRAAAFANMPARWRHEPAEGGLTAYEALQPPLYYWLMAPLLKMIPAADLGTQVMLLRWASVLIASLIAPLAFLIAREVFASSRMAAGCAAIMALMPGLALDVARVGNDCLAVLLYSAVTLFAIRAAKDSRPGGALRLGIALGLGLITKAYFLAALPAAAALIAYQFGFAEGRRRTAIRNALLIAAPAAAIAGWWYARNLVTTGTLSGLSESVALKSSGVHPLARALDINWVKAIDGTLLSHLYFGAWSSLTLRSWMYHLLYAVIAAAACGIALLIYAAARRNASLTGFIAAPAFAMSLAIYAAFWAGQFYNVLLIYASKGIAVSMGWYGYAVVGAQTALCVAGLSALLPRRFRGWSIASGVVLFLLLDMYTLHGLELPYYAGIIAHKANGGIAGLRAADLRVYFTVFERAAEFKGPLVATYVVQVLWIFHAAASLVLAIIGFKDPEVFFTKPSKLAR